MELAEKLGVLGGVARRSEIIRTTADRLALAAGIADEALRDLGGGWVAAASAEPALVTARRFNGTITCISAAPFYGLQLLTAPGRVHVAVPRSRGARPRQGQHLVRLHRESSWTRPAPTGLPLAPIAEVLSRVLRCRSAEEAVVMTDSALNKGLITVEEITRNLAGRGSPQARATLERCDARSRSPIESLARLALADAGLGVQAGVVVDGVGEVDLLVEGWVVVECDGFAYHSGRREYREDRRRDRDLLARGFLVLRFTWEDIMGDPQVVVEAVLRALRRL